MPQEEKKKGTQKTEKKVKKEYLGENTFRPSGFAMLIIAELVLIVNDFNNYVDQYGHSYPARHYAREEGCGHVNWTNAPKHIGSAVWMLLYQLSVTIFATLVIGADLAWREASFSTWGRKWVNMFYAPGLVSGEHGKGLYHYVVANAFLKMFLVVRYMSQSFYGLKGGSHAPPDELARVHAAAGGGAGYMTVTTLTPAAATHATTVIISTAKATATAAMAAGATVVTGPNGGSVFARDQDLAGMAAYGIADTPAVVRRAGFDADDPTQAWGTELWAQWTGWIVLGSVLPCAFVFVENLLSWSAWKDQSKGSGKA